ncbi:MAG: glycosyl hydrolase, partial [Acidobacteria bacterium]|nr:glycosyl hydrolase [Acidobacteriota bacterium]
MRSHPRRLFSTILLALAVPLFAAPLAAAQGSQKKEEGPRLAAKTIGGLELRNLGPALMSGRIADLAIDPNDPNVRYAAVGSGGVWKTTNAGTTWKPIFDGETSYSIGCVTIDPSNSNVVWVGTGENVGGRHVGFGDGVYRSEDGGAHWEKRGLAETQHVSRIVVDPGDPNVVWVAAQGPLWSPGGERGLFKTTDAGESWKKVLGGGEWTGVTDVVLDPRDPDRLYAATWQHQRTVAAYLGGGPESGLHRSQDGGETWEKLTQGLPDGNLGKIGLAISPQRPDVLYAAIELDRRKGGVWRSTDRGASWQKRSDTVSGATGPHYYQELVASPHAFDRIYLMDFRIQVSDDGGTTFRRLKEEHKHSDNHALVFRADDPDYLLVGTDGGIYESFDLAENWRFVANLPVTQFYKIAVDDDAPFYNVYGGTQDNSTQGGPSRTDNASGIRNADWFITLFADGHQPATEPGNPDILYSEWQEGNLVRYDRTTGEIVYIRPQPEPGDAPDRYNWDAPILVSPHSPKRLYYASQRVYRSDDRGDSWRPVSPDLTRDQDRLKLPMMGRQWSWEAPWDMDAMSAFATITSLAESPKAEGLLYAGTDDGLLQVSEDGGATWRKIDVSSLPGVPAGAFVNDVKADLFDADTVYVALDHHKSGDFRPFLYKSSDRGRSWRSIAGDLPERHLVWRVVQDHVKKELLFAATEFGVFFTVDGGGRWIELEGGVPTISFRDLQIQRRENDLVAASFGRGLWVLDDYSP